MDEAARSSGLGTRATLIKFCVKVFLDDLEARGEKSLPRGWREIVEALDSRTVASREAGNVFKVAEKNERYTVKRKTKTKEAK